MRFLLVLVLVGSTLLAVAGLWSLAVGFGIRTRMVVLVVLGVTGMVSAIALLLSRHMRP